MKILMTNCKLCGQEIIQGDFEGEIDICTDCILTSSRNYGVKAVSLLCFIVIDGAFFVTSFLQLIFGIPSLISNFEQNFIYFIVSLIMSIVSGGFLIVYFSVSRYKSSHRSHIVENRVSPLT